MKLLFCENCWDVFKLSGEPRSCKCGKVTGHYTDNMFAVTNGRGVSLALGNGAVIQAITEMRAHQHMSKDLAGRSAYYQPGQGLIVYAWARPNEGPGNPHTKVVPDGQE